MKLFSWMQNKLNGKAQVCKKTNAAPTTLKIQAPYELTDHIKQDSREEFSDWPHGLLAIGTFGNNNIKQNNEIKDEEENEEHQIEEDPSSSDHDLQDFTPEEIGKLQKELTKLLSKKPTKEKEKEIANLPLDRFLNCPSSLEVDRRISTNTGISDLDEKEDDIERTISVILGRCKDICENNKKKDIGKKSISFLLKKMFVCRSGFAPQPSLRDTLQESRMEKLLRTLLHKKINPQSASRASSMKKYIEDTKKDQEDEPKRNKTSDGSKWVKTDSEYIVLEI